MERTTSWIKKQIQYLISSIRQIIQGLFFFSLTFSGLGCALLLRNRGYNGAVITIVGVLVEAFGLILCYFLFKGYLQTEEVEVPHPKKKGTY